MSSDAEKPVQETEAQAPQPAAKLEPINATSQAIPTPKQAETRIKLMDAEGRSEERRAKVRILGLVTAGIFFLILVDLIPQFFVPAYAGHTREMLPILTGIVGYLFSEVSQGRRKNT